MANCVSVSTHARYRLGATALGVAGGLSCLGALTTGHGTTLLVAGMLSLAASMLVMSLRPRQTCVRATASESEEQDKPDGAVELATNTGAERPRERKKLTWSI